MSLGALFSVALGGASGAISRYLLSLGSLRVFGAAPWGTLTANLLGCLLMGVLVQWLSRHVVEGGLTAIAEQHRLLFGVGFCGAFTTLSALVVEVAGMAQRDAWLSAFGYLTVTIVGGFACFYLGAVLMRTG